MIVIVMQSGPLAAHLDRVELEVVEDRLRVLAEELPEGVWGCGLLPHGECRCLLPNGRFRGASDD
jgi:hypothetical protein